MHKRYPMNAFGLTTAMAAVMLSGCATNSAPTANVSAAQATQAMANGQHSRAVQAAEAAVAADPRNAAYRMVLGNAYLEAGRFGSAATSFEDAMALGENSPRAALSLALALTGQARYSEASAMLRMWEGEIAASDLGLAFALAGEPDRGIHLLTNAIRGGDSSVKTRQNLAYAYAVAGRWREARMMAAQDVPAHEVGTRMAEWAQLSHSDAYQARIAGLLGVPANVRDGGQPVHLALANAPSAEQLAAEATQPAAAPALAAVEPARMSVPASGAELPPVGGAQEALPLPPVQTRAPAPTGFAEAFAADDNAVRPVSRPQAAPALPALAEAPAPAQTQRPVPAPVVAAPELNAARPVSRAARPAVAPARETITPAIARPTLTGFASYERPVEAPTHLVQLGSFSSEARAKQAWDIYLGRYPELSRFEMVITEAVVNGRNYWRVSAGGYDTASSRAMCDRVDAENGEGCISWAANRPLPGAVDTGVRLARR